MDDVSFWREVEGITTLDLQMAEFLCEGLEQRGALYPIFVLLSHFAAQQNSGLPCRELVNKPLSDIIDLDEACSPHVAKAVPVSVHYEEALASAKSRIAHGDGDEPVVYHPESGILFFHRYHTFEQSVAKKIVSKCQVGDAQQELSSSLIERIQSLFPEDASPDGQVNWQKVAAISALRHPFCVITGGPGTGKTTTVAKILALGLERDPNQNIVLLAPTGKAADRLVSSISKALQDPQKDFPGVSPSVLENIPRQAKTCHRFLEYRPGVGFQLNADDPSSADVILIDEASMVSLELYYHILNAIKPHCRVVLLGDPHQLSPVQAGHVLGDLVDLSHSKTFSPHFCNMASKDFGLSLQVEKETKGLRDQILNDQIVELAYSYRFTAESGVGQLARCVLDAEQPDASTLSHVFTEFPDALSSLTLQEAFPDQAISLIRVCMESYLSALKFGDVALMLKHLDDFRILCAKNTGIYGVQRLNELVSKALFQVEEHRDVDGKIIMITKNEHHLKLYNGDVGLIYKGQAWFPSAEGPRAMSIAGLPERTSAYAMTIHKSQGSEFQNVMLILDDRDGSHLNKDLIYTGITRAKATLTMIHDCDVTSQAICRQEQRVSGLASRMRAEASISP